MGTKEGAAKARAKRNSRLVKMWSSKGGKAVKPENRPFYKDRKLASRAGKLGGQK